MLSVPRGTEMFQFPRFPLPALCVQTGVTPHHGCRVSPFGYLRINAWSAAPRSFSQPPTSFIGVRCQGIHRWLFVAWKNKDARARYAVLKELRARTKVPPGDEDAGASHWVASPALPRGQGSSLPQNRREDTVSRTGWGVGRGNLRPTPLPGPDRARLQLGVVPAVRRNIDSLERR